MTSGETSKYPGKELEAMSFARNYHQWIVDELEPYLGETCVEVGAGVGDLTTLLLQKDIKRLYAFEPASNLFSSFCENLKGRSRAEPINAFFEPDRVGAVDSVLYVNVLEHIRDDQAELLKAHQALIPGGHLLLFVPALAWLFSGADSNVGHYRRYYRKGLLRQVREAGFLIEKARYFDFAGIWPWYVNFVLLKNTFRASSVALYDRLVVPPLRALETLVNPPIGKNLLVVGKKEN